MKMRLAELRDALSVSHKSAKTVASSGFNLRAWLRLVRPQQYAKNVLVFVPLLAAHQFSLAALTRVSITFLAFCLCASSIYLANDVVDVDADRRHPTKRRRPLAAGTIAPLHAVLVAPVLLIVGLMLGAAISWNVALILVGYFCLSTAYSFWLKRKVVLDIIVLGILYCVRLFGGAVAIDVMPSPWLLGFSIFIFAGLALIKRYTELAMRGALGLNDSMNRAYEVDDLGIIGALAAGAGFNAVTLFALYIASDAVRPLYSKPWLLWFICPLMMYGFARMLLLAHRGLVDDDPIVFAFRDRTSLQLVALMILIVLIAI
jgi:4-hydroxybenzoate polyprenyltransferase